MPTLRSVPFAPAPRSASVSSPLASASALPVAAALMGAIISGDAYAQSPFMEPTAAITHVGTGIDPEAADFDGDGHVDVIMRNEANRGLALFRGLGGGAFDVPIRIEPGHPRISTYDLGDIDGDGDPDILISTADPSTPIRIITTSPSGFTTRALSLPESGYLEGRLADVNGDGALDLLTVRYNGTNFDHAWFENVGGTFPGSAQFITSGQFGIFEVEDIDGDGFVDLASPAINNTLRVNFGIGGGAFAPTALLSGHGGSALFPLSLRDVNGDGLMEIFQVKGTGIQYFQATGPRTYAAPVSLIPSLETQNTTVFFDIDADGDLDLLNSTYLPTLDATVLAFEQVAPGVFGPPVPTTAEPRRGMVIGDLNGDGREDLIFNSGEGLQWQVGGLPAASGYFGAVNWANEAVSEVTSYGVADLDSDGDLDILASSRPEGTLGWVENLGGGELARVALLRAPGYAPSFIKPVDFEGDGDTDIVLETRIDNTSVIEVLINDGTTTFAPQGSPTPLPTTAHRDVQVRDFNSDGLMDVLIVRASAASNNLRAADLLLSLPGGGFAPPTNVVSETFRALVIQAADVNGDGLPDIVHDGEVPSGLSQIFVSLNQGGGVFAPAVLQVGPDVLWVGSISIEDFDSDGFMDVIMKPYRTAPTLHRGDGTSMLGQPIPLQLADFDGPIDIADVDSDGDFDIFSSRRVAWDDVVYCEQLPGGSFAAPVLLFPGDPIGTYAITMGDLDGDRDPEAILLRSPSHSDAPIQVYDNGTLSAIGQGICGAQTPNSSGAAGTLTAYGSGSTTLNRIELPAAQLPANQFAMLLGSRTFGAPMPLGTSPGLLCLTGGIGRYQGPGQIMNSGAAGALTFSLDLSALSLPNGPVMGLPGETWSFQAWHRDTLAGTATSQLTTGVSVTLR